MSQRVANIVWKYGNSVITHYGKMIRSGPHRNKALGP